MKVIGTAGHIDHGKSTLVHRLTGIDPDRLEEEKRRGMTIDLGFAWLTLPSGEEVSIVDVPGHERFVKNMLAGVGGIDVALLVVAADEAVMPQTREHLDILDLLGVRHGVVALTKRDLVDEEWLLLAAADVADVLAGTSLEGSEIVPVSAKTGEGIPDLLSALTRALDAAPERADRGLPYLPVDRVFTVSGFGTVVTGTLHDGTLRVGQEVEISPSGRRARIRSLQTHRRQVESAPPGARVAVNLAGADRESVGRGDVLALPGTLDSVRRFDARIHAVRDAPFALEHGTQVSLHVGSAERAATISTLGAETIEPGQEGWVQLRLSDPVPAVTGQRFIVRLPAPARTIAGGFVADLAPRHRRSDPRAIARLEDLCSASLDRRLLASFRAERTAAAPDLARALRVPLTEVLPRVDVLAAQGRLLPVGDGYLPAEAFERLAERTRHALQTFHTAYPLKQGMPREELRRKLRWPAGQFAALLDALAARGMLREEGAAVALAEHRGGVGSRRAEADRVLASLTASPFAPPSGQELLDAASATIDLLSAMAEAGEIVRVGDGLYLAAGAYDRLVTEILSMIDREGQVTVASVRDAFGTSRKYALALLEHLDGQRVTRRVGDARVRGSKAPACA